jgi:hypothetical protein
MKVTRIVLLLDYELLHFLSCPASRLQIACRIIFSCFLEAAFHVNNATIFIVTANELYLVARYLERKIHRNNSPSAVSGVDVLDWVVISVWKDFCHVNLAIVLVVLDDVVFIRVLGIGYIGIVMNNLFISRLVLILIITFIASILHGGG